jgi:diguanylate cyclase (GGDEF)-like protein
MTVSEASANTALTMLEPATLDQNGLSACGTTFHTCGRTVSVPPTAIPGIKILMVEDVDTDAELEARCLKNAGVDFTLTRVQTERDFRYQLLELAPDVIICDFALPEFDGLSALRILREQRPDTPFIFVSGNIGEDRAVESLKEGASDYILKTNLARLPHAVRRVIKEAEDRRLRVSHEHKIARLSRIHAVLSSINAAVVRTRSKAKLFQEVCAIAVRHGVFQMVWIGAPESANGGLMPIAWDGTEKSTCATDMAATLCASDLGASSRAFCENVIVVDNDVHNRFGLESNTSQGFRSSIALPLSIDEKPIAVLAIYATDAHIFDQEEVNLLKELASDVSFALDYLDKEERLKYLAYYDVLTGLPNRNLLTDRLAQGIAHCKRFNTTAAVLFVDLDNFKWINDSLGHSAGDRLLKAMGKRLTDCTRDGDTVARLGGDEFVIVLPGQTDRQVTTHILDRILESVRQPFKSQSGEFHIGCSIGVALYPQDGHDVDTLLKHSDAALYRAKESGRNTFRFYEEKMNAKLNERLTLETNLRRALARDEFFLHYQPQIDLRTGRLVGVEALLRWTNGELGDVPPAKFIAIAEESDLILAIGTWVARCACRQNKAWQDAGLPPILMSVNVSARQFRAPGLSEILGTILSETGLPPHYLGLELTESAVMHDSQDAIATMQALTAMGLDLSIDDFGTGYSSLSYLKKFPISTLKIDRSFVRDIPRDSDDTAIAQAIITMGHSLGLKVIAEGVETLDQANFLRVQNCDIAQGYYYSKPVNHTGIETLLTLMG